MPINDLSALRTSLKTALQSQNFDPVTKQKLVGLSGTEVTRLVSELKKDGVTDDEVKAVVDVLVAEIQTGYDAALPREQKNIGKLLDTLNRIRPGVVGDTTGFQSPTGIKWIELLQARAGGITPPPPPPPPPGPGVTGTRLDRTTFDNKSVTVSADGKIGLGPDAQPVSLAVRGNVDGASLLSMVKPGMFSKLDATSKAALATNLVSQLTSTSTGLPIDPTSKEKQGAVLASFAHLGMLTELASSLTPAQADQLASLSGKTPSTMQEALLRKALDGGPQTPAVVAAKAKWPAADAEAKLEGEHGKLMEAFQLARDAKFPVSTSTGAWGATTTSNMAEVPLTCLAQAKSSVAVDNIKKGLAEWSKLDGQPGFTAAEEKAVLKSLSPYVNGASSTNLVFGAFVSEAPKEIGKILQAATAEKLLPLLTAAKPMIAGYPLSASQAAFVQTLVPGIKDDAAIASIGKALQSARAAFDPTMSSWGTPTTPTTPLSEAAFAVFQRAAAAALEGKAGTTDGMIDGKGLESMVASEAKVMGDSVKPFLTDLATGVIRDRSVTPVVTMAVSTSLAAELKALVLSTANSSMTVPNLAMAASVVAAKNGGKLDGAGAATFSKILTDYRAEFPALSLLDYNKLARIATFAVDGKPVPLSSINGVSVPFAEVYNKVGEAVMNSIDKASLPAPWMATRWGLRAKAAIEILDVVAQKTAEKRGPIVVLQNQFPGASVKVLATGRDGEHQRFVYEVKSGTSTKLFAEGSDGTVSTYDPRSGGDINPVMFSATIKGDGSYDVGVPSTRKMPKYPLQTPFGLNTKIDMGYDDGSTLVDEEGKPFNTPYKLAEATIKSYTPAGRYTIEYQDSKGTTVTKEVSLDDIRKYNTPHWFSLNGSRFSDTNIDLSKDDALKAFVDGAQPIIQKHLPQDGSLLKLSPALLVKRQRDCVAELMEYAADHMVYPSEGAGADDASKKYHELEGGFSRFNLGELVKIKRGVCRHQCILQQLLMQQAGIDSRLASGAANTSSGAFRGYHIWTELTLADNARYLSDQTWSDVAIPLWTGAYSARKDRVELYDWTSRYNNEEVDDIRF